jgi:predicted nucleic acid-binding Zn ribbon protein
MRSCIECGTEFKGHHNARLCSKACRNARTRKRENVNPEPTTCDVCGVTFKPYSSNQKTCSKACRTQVNNKRRRVPTDVTEAPAGHTRRCRAKLCIERFIPQNPNHWWHEAACRESDLQWDVEEILAEEGALTLNASHLELAKSAFGQKNRALRENSRLRSLREYLTYEIQSFHDENPEYRFPTVKAPKKDTGKKGEREILVQLSDWQVGKWEAGFGVEGTMARVDALMDSVASIVQRQRDAGYKVNRIVTSFGGDMVEGCAIYGAQRALGLDKTSNTHRLTQQIRTVAYKMSEFVTFCGTLAPQVDAYVVGGNHGRTNGPNDYADPEDNFDVMSAWWASDLTRDTKHINWHISENWWGEVFVAGHRGISLHGDQWNGPFSKLETLLPQWVTAGVFGEKPAFVLVHHRHEERQVEIGGIPVFQNGTIDGGSGWYLRSFGRASRPFQRVLTFSEKYVPESQWPIYLQGHVSGAAA